jgi:hypothetical protein
MQDSLLFVANLDLVEKFFDFRVFIGVEEQSIHEQRPLRRQLVVVVLLYVFVPRIRQTRILILGTAFHRVACRKLNADIGQPILFLCPGRECKAQAEQKKDDTEYQASLDRLEIITNWAHCKQH